MTEYAGICRAMEGVKATTEALAEASKATFARPLFDAEVLTVYTRPVADVKAFASPVVDIDAWQSKDIRESLDGIARFVKSVAPDIDYESNFRDFDFESMSLPLMRNRTDELQQENAELQHEIAGLRRRVSALEMKRVFPDDADFPH